MYFNSYEAQMIKEERMKDALRETEQGRLGRVAKSARPRFLGQVVASIGGLLVSAGKKLQEPRAGQDSGDVFTTSPQANDKTLLSGPVSDWSALHG